MCPLIPPRISSIGDIFDTMDCVGRPLPQDPLWLGCSQLFWYWAYALELFKISKKHTKEFDQEIISRSQNWDSTRITLMDKLIL